MSNVGVDVLLGFQLSSAEKLMPGCGASGPAKPDQTNSFIMRLDGEANEARHRPLLPSWVGASPVNCDCKRNGFTSAAHMRADTYSFWKAVRPVSYWACFAAGLAGECDSLLLSLLLPDEQASSEPSSTRQGKMTIFLMRSSAVSS